MNDRYFDWLIDLVNADDILRLCTILDTINYHWSILLDENRMYDAFSLRELYLDDTGRNSGRNNTGCSLFEMLVALAHRCDVDIMYDYTVGHRYGLWFHLFLESLFSQYADNFADLSEEEIIDICEKFLSRDYERDGSGGMFPVSDHRDQRKVQIWMQMNLWLVENQE